MATPSIGSQPQSTLSRVDGCKKDMSPPLWHGKLAWRDINVQFQCCCLENKGATCRAGIDNKTILSCQTKQAPPPSDWLELDTIRLFAQEV